MPKAGELWLAEIPFTSGMTSKLRPVLVLWEDILRVMRASSKRPGPSTPSYVSTCKALLPVRAGFIERLGIWPPGNQPWH